MDFSEVVSCVHYTNATTFVTWVTMDRLFMRLFDTVISCNV